MITKENMFSVCLKEVKLSYLFIKSDIFAVIIPGTLVLLASWISCGASLLALPLYLLYSLSFCFLFLYTVCLSNQVISIEEDKKNKPWRPLPTGLICIEGAYTRLIFANILFLLLSYYLHVFYFAILWQLLTFFYAQWGFTYPVDRKKSGIYDRRCFYSVLLPMADYSAIG